MLLCRLSDRLLLRSYCLGNVFVDCRVGGLVVGLIVVEPGRVHDTDGRVDFVHSSKGFLNVLVDGFDVESVDVDGLDVECVDGRVAERAERAGALL